MSQGKEVTLLNTVRLFYCIKSEVSLSPIKCFATSDAVLYFVEQQAALPLFVAF
jgi:hypothetical protein